MPPSPQILGRSCNVTTPLPQMGLCPNPTDYCVYKNESGGPTSSSQICYDAIFGETTLNANGTEIQCTSDQVWCPQQFEYNPTQIVQGTRGVCVPSGNLCDYGESGLTEYGCEFINSSMPGFMHNKDRCLYDFEKYGSPGIDDPPWPQACCEFLRVNRANQPDYLFFNENDVIIY